MGVHTLQQTVKKMCSEAGFEGQFTNHSLRATAATRLYAAGVDKQLIAKKTMFGYPSETLVFVVQILHPFLVVMIAVKDRKSASFIKLEAFIPTG